MSALFDVAAFVEAIGQSDSVSDAQHASLEKLCKKIDVVGRVRTHYTADLSRAASEEVIAKETAQLLRAAYLAAPHDLKYVNSALKLTDIYGLEPIDISHIKLAGEGAKNNPEIAPHSGEPKELDITLLADPVAPTSIAYLRYMAHAGFFPKRIILLDYLGHSTKNKYMQALLGKRFAARLLRGVRARRMKAQMPRHFMAQAQQHCPVFMDYHAPIVWEDYTNQLEVLPITGLDDPALRSRLSELAPVACIYSASGLVPASLLSVDGLKVLHFHPGLVPDVRGSDGLLWSLAVKGVPGCSAFYMDAGIDTGEVIAKSEFALPPSGMQDMEAYFQALLYYFDPNMRGQLLAQILQSHEGKDWAHLPKTPQSHADGRTYFLMHPKLRARVLSRFA